MMKRLIFFLTALAASWLLAPAAWAMTDDHAGYRADYAAELLAIQHTWAQIKYRTPKAKRRQAFASLLHQTELLHRTYPNSADALVWSAVVLYNYAGEVRGIRALGMIKQSRRMLQQAEKTDPKAADGLVHTALGQLYYKVPGWPIAFGSDALAEKYLHKGLKLNPDGLDANYFMGDYLLHRKQYCQAAVHLRIALHAPARAERSIADAGRKADALKLLRQAENRFRQHESALHQDAVSLSQRGGCPELSAS